MNEHERRKPRSLVLSPQQCQSTEIGGWLAAMNDSRGRTERAVAGILPQELEWVGPHHRNTIGTLLYHIAAIELDWLYAEVLEEEFPADCASWFPQDVRGEDGELSVITGESLDHHADRLGYVRGHFNRTFERFSLAEFERVRQLEAYDVSPRWVIHHLLQHEAEHRGQIATLRLLYKERT